MAVGARGVCVGREYLSDSSGMLRHGEGVSLKDEEGSESLQSKQLNEW